jgi:hypothetical protein
VFFRTHQRLLWHIDSQLFRNKNLFCLEKYLSPEIVFKARLPVLYDEVISALVSEIEAASEDQFERLLCDDVHPANYVALLTVNSVPGITPTVPESGLD